MSAVVVEDVRQAGVERKARRHVEQGVGRGVERHLVLVPTGRDAVLARRAGGRAADAERVCGAAPTMRLTRFGRLVRTVLVAGVIAVLGVGLAGQLASASGDARTITVHAGQTLSGIAVRELPELSVTDGVVELQVANGLSTSQIHAGQQLVIPAH
ncbi:LysM peptidoglycan-binding domain-containing protein [Terrabacter sp. NPDC080008]|uniref:LysM peptidoglycan-binding domain-containing protein n=1 Tax=Terrabacter sp. NPDC080008 TaxID=3155176 RepID=UPI00344CDB11